MKILAVDFGDARTGLACCDPTQTLASPIGCIKERNFRKTAEAVAQAAEQTGCGTIVVGHPKNMDGSEGQRAQKCADFAAELQKMVPCPVVLYDERCTTMEAAHLMDAAGTFGRRRKEQIDEASAAIILEDYLRSLANRR